ncbi:MAG: hypothetical protein K0R73_162 [Candidatus Midichloriaceae bacterium]|nr:hypothetical protein [Candidatus Midichloriaceae bacterium]
MFGSKIEVSFLVYSLPYIEDVELLKKIDSTLVSLLPKSASFTSIINLNKIRGHADNTELYKSAISALYNDILICRINIFEVLVDSDYIDFGDFLKDKLNFSNTTKEKILAEYIGKIPELANSGNATSFMDALMAEVGQKPKIDTVKVDLMTSYIEKYISAILSSGALNPKEKGDFLKHSLPCIPDQILKDKDRRYSNHPYIWSLGKFNREYQTYTAKNATEIKAVYKKRLNDAQKSIQEKLLANQKEFKERERAILKEREYKIHNAKILCEFTPLFTMLTALGIARKNPEPIYIASAAVFIANNTGASDAFKLAFSGYMNKYCILVGLLTLTKSAYEIEFTGDYIIILITPMILLCSSSYLTSYFDDRATDLLIKVKEEEKQRNTNDKGEATEIQNAIKSEEKQSLEYYNESFLDILKGVSCKSIVPYKEGRNESQLILNSGVSRGL